MGEQDADDALARSALARIARGDEGALEELHSLYASAVFAFVSARLGDRGAAEEAAVDVWLGCWRSAAAFRGDSRVLTWLLGIAKRQACMRMRRIRPEELPLDEDLTQLADEAGDPSDALMAQAGIGEIVAALDALPAALAETVRLAWLHELPYAE
ncbi:MAG: RNA polymerase sigma factor, partial [Eggerthella lenta]